MNKRNILTAVLSLSLVGAISVGATMAYLTSTTQTAKNTFTVGSVNITQKEYQDANSTVWNNSDPHILQPGVTTFKEPVVTVTKGSENCYVYMKVDAPQALEDLLANKKVSVDGLDPTKWKKVGTSTTLTGVYQYVGKPVVAKDTAKDTQLDPLFTGIKIDADTTAQDLEALKGNTSVFDITVASFAIQADGHNMSVEDQLKEAKW